MSTRSRGAVGLLVLATSASFSTLAYHERPPRPPGTLRVAHETELVSLDPAFAESATQSVLSNVYEALAGFDRDMALVPALAESWTSLDEHTWLLELRRGVRFHGSGPLTASEVVRALERARGDPRSSAAGKLSGVVLIEARNQHCVLVRTREPDPLLINRLAYVLVAREVGGPGGALAGTGPYRVARWEPGRFLELEANRDHWRGWPAIPRVRFSSVPEGDAGASALARGQVDVLRFLSDAAATRVGATPGLRVVSQPSLSIFYLWLDARARRGNPLADARVREAISLAVDREALAERVGRRTARADQLAPKGVFGHLPELAPLRYDPTEARALLAEAGHASGFELELVHSPAVSIQQAATAVAEMLSAAGVSVRTRKMAWPELLEAWRSRRVGFLLAGWQFENGDSTSFLLDTLRSRAASPRHGAYNLGFSDPALDALIAQAALAWSSRERLRAYRRLMPLARERAALIPLYARENLYGVSERVRWQPRLDGKLLASDMAWAEAER